MGMKTTQEDYIMQKRVFSMLLCVCMLMSIASIPAMAATAVNTFNVTVEEPKAGAKPAETASVPENASTYVTGVEWKGTFDKNGNFMKGKTYIVRVTVRVKEGTDKYIQFVSGKAKINGANANVIEISDDKQQAVITRTLAVGLNTGALSELVHGGRRQYHHAFDSGACSRTTAFQDRISAKRSQNDCQQRGMDGKIQLRRNVYCRRGILGEAQGRYQERV